MNNKELIISDTHIDIVKEYGTYPNGVNRKLHDGMNILEQIYNLAVNENIKRITHLGDLMERKDNIPNEILCKVSEIISRMKNAGIMFRLLLGNHDFQIQFYPFANALCDCGVLQLICDPVILGRRAYIPYQRDVNDFINIWETFHRKNNFDYLFFHNELPGYYIVSRELKDFRLPLFENVKYIGGHLHYKQMLLNKIEYIGNTHHIKFGDESTRYVHILEDNILKPVKLDYPDMITINFNELHKDLSGKYIRISDSMNYEDWKAWDKGEFKNKILSMGAIECFFDIKINYSNRKKTEFKENTDYILHYVNNSNTELNKEKLIVLGRKFI